MSQSPPNRATTCKITHRVHTPRRRKEAEDGRDGGSREGSREGSRRNRRTRRRAEAEKETDNMIIIIIIPSRPLCAVLWRGPVPFGVSSTASRVRRLARLGGISGRFHRAPPPPPSP
eukprot:8088075-Pyramimonas_sp.AAC.1